jgi:hypothetical protein
MPPTWLALLAPLPDDAVVERKPVASPDLLAAGKAEAIAGWDSITVNLSDPGSGLRHVLITVDAAGTVISGGDGVLFHREEQRGNILWTISDHHNIGGRFEIDGSFRGTRWQTHIEQIGGEEEPVQTASTPSPPAPEDVERLRALVQWVMARAPEKRP